MSMTTNDWRKEAACKGKNLDFWFPPLESSTLTPYFAVAKMVCERCPVWQECLEAGMDEVWGVWGGLTPHERRSIYTRGGAHIKPHGTVTRFRQGCSCSECRTATDKNNGNIDMTLIPNVGENDYNLRIVRDSVMKSVRL